MSKPAVKLTASAPLKIAASPINTKTNRAKKAGTKAKVSTAPIKNRASAEIKKTLHPRNAHLHGYDFPALINALPKLKTFVRPTAYGALSIDFADHQAVKMLNTALLKHHYGIEFWDIPTGALCPPPFLAESIICIM